MTPVACATEMPVTPVKSLLDLPVQDIVSPSILPLPEVAKADALVSVIVVSPTDTAPLAVVCVTLGFALP